MKSKCEKCGKGESLEQLRSPTTLPWLTANPVPGNATIWDG